MLKPDFLKMLRCPLDPTRSAELTQPDETHLLCGKCAVRYPVRDGFPILLVDEAILPDGCTGIDKLPCQQPPGPNPA